MNLRTVLAWLACLLLLGCAKRTAVVMPVAEPSEPYPSRTVTLVVVRMDGLVPIAGASVVLLNQPASHLTDERGVTVFSQIRDSPDEGMLMDLRVSKSGCRDREGPVFVNAGQQTIHIPLICN